VACGVVDADVVAVASSAQWLELERLHWFELEPLQCKTVGTNGPVRIGKELQTAVATAWTNKSP
jgi:hypothetical protein